MTSADSVRVAYPLFQADGGGSSPTSALHARDLTFERCERAFAGRLNSLWHSRLPVVYASTMMYAFMAHKDSVVYAVGLWSNPSARQLNQSFLELRRMACAPDAPPNTASRFLAWQVRWIKQNCPLVQGVLSFQDTSVHKGTMYKASGWTLAYKGKPMARDRSKLRRGTRSLYRSNVNGDDVDHSPKYRWEYSWQERR